MRLHRFAPLAGAALILPLSGCSTLPKSRAPEEDPPAPTARYTTGRLLQDFAYPASVVAKAIPEAMDELGIPVVRKNRDGTAAQIQGRTPDGRSVVITMRTQPPITRLSCRVGWFGDEPMSRAIMRRVAVRLGALPPEPVPDKLPSRPSPNPYISRTAIPDAVMAQDQIEAPYRNRPDF
jgi:hypothetical protein